ncbi:MAG: hypothetical protein U9Q07_02605, partial [Planctomycetota bacterium]|nr:hypothetical protein [Planctomycetota bacterium]
MAQTHTQSRYKIHLIDVSMRSMLWAVLVGLLLMGTAAAELYEPAREPFVEIAGAGQPKAQIVTPSRPTYLEEFAASELQSYLERVSGVRIPIVREGDSGRFSYSFLLGMTQRAVEAGTRPDDEMMGRDGFELRSIPGGLIVRGRNDLGTVFGVYELLERYFEVRWFMPGELGEHVPQSKTLRMGQVHLVFKPSFRVRWVGTGEWALRQRMNAYVKAGSRNVGINWKWHFHTFRILIPPEKYYAEHPEYYA